MEVLDPHKDRDHWCIHEAHMWESIHMSRKPMVHLSARKVRVLERERVFTMPVLLGVLQCF